MAEGEQGSDGHPLEKLSFTAYAALMQRPRMLLWATRALSQGHQRRLKIGLGIAIALLGKSHPLGVVLASILFAAMRNGATRMQFLTQMPVDLISMLQALILLFVAADAIIRYIYRIKAKGERVVLTRGWGG